MLNHVKICCQIKKFSKQWYNFDHSVCMTAICYSRRISAVPTNKQLLEEKKTCVKFQIDISKTVGLVRLCTDRRTWLNRLSFWMLQILLQFIIPCSGYKKVIIKKKKYGIDNLSFQRWDHAFHMSEWNWEKCDERITKESRQPTRGGGTHLWRTKASLCDY